MVEVKKGLLTYHYLTDHIPLIEAIKDIGKRIPKRLFIVKEPVTCATTSNINANYYYDSDNKKWVLEGVDNGTLPAIDGVVLSVNDRVLIKDQNNKYQNGVYTVVSLGNSGGKFKLVRSDDLDEDTDFDGNIIIPVKKGQVNSSKTFTIKTENVILAQRTDIEFVELFLVPDGKVEVSETDEIAGYLNEKIIAGNNITITKQTGPDGSEQLVISGTGGGGISGSGTQNYLTKWSGSDVLTNSIIYDNGTNVGIGTTTPSQKLTVAGNIGIKAGTNAYIGTIDNYALSFRTNSADRIYITNDGNVGIGTTNPIYKLDVNGSIRVSGQTVFNNVAYTWPSTAGSSGQVLTTDGTGNLSWTTVSGGGGGGGWCGNAQSDLNMNGYNVINFNELQPLNDYIMLYRSDEPEEIFESQQISIGIGTKDNYYRGIGIGFSSYNNSVGGIGIGFVTTNNCYFGIGIGSSANCNSCYGIGIGHFAFANYCLGVGIGAFANNNYSCGIGIGYVACNNYCNGIGIGYCANNNYCRGIGIGTYAGYNYNYGIGVGPGTNNNSNCGIGIGYSSNFNCDGGVGIGLGTFNNRCLGVGIGTFAHDNYNGGVGIGKEACDNHDYGVGIGYLARGNYCYGIGIGYNSCGNYNYGIGIGHDTNYNYNCGIGIGYNADMNYDNGIGIGAYASYNCCYGIGIGYMAAGNAFCGIGIGIYAQNNCCYGIGIGNNTNNNYCYGIGIGYMANNNYCYAIGIGACSSSNQPYSVAIGARTYAANSAVVLGYCARANGQNGVAIGCGATANAQNSIAIGPGTVNNYSGTVSFGNYTVYTAGDFEVTDSSKGLILKSPNGTRFRVRVNDSGTLIITSV